MNPLAVMDALLRHDLRERELRLALVILRHTLLAGSHRSQFQQGFSDLLGYRERECQALLRDLVRAGVVLKDGDEIGLRPDPRAWKIRERTPAGAEAAPAQQIPLLTMRPLDAALIAQELDCPRGNPAAPAPPAAPEPPAKIPRPPEPEENSGAEFPRPPRENSAPQAKALAQASRRDIQSSAKALASPPAQFPRLDSGRVVDLCARLERLLGPREWPRYRDQWTQLAQDAPDYVAALLSDYEASALTRPIQSPGGWMSRIARDENRWPQARP